MIVFDVLCLRVGTYIWPCLDLKFFSQSGKKFCGQNTRKI